MRVEGIVSFGCWKTTTFLAALRCGRIAAPWVFDGPIDGRTSLVWTEEALAPTLRPDDIVVLGKSSSHKAAGIGAAVEARGAELACLPPCSPGLNPSGVRRRPTRAPKGTRPAGRGGEQLLAEPERLLRKVAARPVDALREAIGRLLETFGPQDGTDCLTKSG